jgi:phosphate ABC transporter permease subunit PstA
VTVPERTRWLGRGGSDPRPERSRSTRGLGGASLSARGEPMLWLTSGSLVIALAMIVGLCGWVGWHGLGTFWPQPVVRIETPIGAFLGEVTEVERYRPGEHATSDWAEGADAAAVAAMRRFIADHGEVERRHVRLGNFELTGKHYDWIPAFAVLREDRPEWAVVVERLEWGRFFGFPSAYVEATAIGPVDPGAERDEEAIRAEGRQVEAQLEPPPGGMVRWIVERREDGARVERLLTAEELSPRDRAVAVARVWPGAETAWRRFEERHAEVAARRAVAASMRKRDVGDVNARIEDARLLLREAELQLAPSPVWVSVYLELKAARLAHDDAAAAVVERRLRAIEHDLGRPSEAFMAVVGEVERRERDAQRDFERISKEIFAIEQEIATDALWFTTTTPGQEKRIRLAEIVRAYPANQLGAIGRLGVYGSRWWEYLSAEPRESNNEGGIFPAIFGTVLMTLIMCLIVVPFGVLAALYLREYARAGPVISAVRIAVNNLAGVPSIVFGVFGLGFFCYIVGASIDELLFEARLPQPTFGKSGLIWASLTLALMTAPVVIVATEEALAAVPSSMREGSYACGASKWQTIRRIVLPRAMPGIMTGAILAMARGAGEVAPLMLVGAVKLAPVLPIDIEPPFGLNRSFMHLGFHIYDLGFQSQNSEAAKQLVYTTTTLLILIVAALNLTAIWLRSRLRRRFVTSHF